MKNKRGNTSALNGRYDFYKTCLDDAFQRNIRVFLLCFIATFVWGLLAHSYIFLHSSFSHDAINEFNTAVFGNNLRMQRGRVFVPAYRTIVRGNVILPWLIGVLSLLYIALAVFMTVKLFHIRSKVLMVFVSGIFTVNISVIATAASYIHDLDCNMLALALAVLSVYLWKRFRKGYLYGMLPLCVSMGLYQGYLSVAVTLIVLYLIMRLLDGEQFKIAFQEGLKSIGMIIGAGVMYFFAVKIGCYLAGIPLQSGEYNSIDKALSMSAAEIVFFIIKDYLRTPYRILTVSSVYPTEMTFIVHVIIIAIPGILILRRVFQKEFKVKERILTLALIALLPIAMNVIYPISNGLSYELTEYGLCFVYLFALLVVWWAAERFSIRKALLKCLSLCLVFLVLWGNVRTANALYIKKDLEGQANLSLFTRIVSQMESCEGYVTGETPVVFVGSPSAMLDGLAGFENIQDITGCSEPFVLFSGIHERYRAYFDYVLLSPAVMADPDVWLQMQDDSRVAEMPCYPADGSIRMIDDIMVVKFE